MAPKFSPQKRAEILERVLEKGESVKKVCQEYGISRTLFYRWKKRYQKASQDKKLAALKPRPPEPKKKHHRHTPRHLVEAILEIVRRCPEYSTQKISQQLPKNEEGKPAVGNHGVQNILERKGLNTYEKRLAFAKRPREFPPEVAPEVAPEAPGKLTPQERLAMIEEAVKEGAKVAEVCRENGISRTLFYRLKKRYDEAAEEKKLTALKDRKPKIERYWHQAPEKYEQAVLKVVVEHPELSSRKIVSYLPKIAGKPILGNHGVQNVLRRNNLNTYGKRLGYSQAQLKIAPRFVEKAITSLQEALTSLFGMPAPARQTLVRNVGVASFALFFLVVALGFRAYLSHLFRVPYASRPGLVFASVSLGVGSFFFLYSLKYYFTLALVLSFSRQAGEMFESAPASVSSGKNILSRIFNFANNNGLVKNLNNRLNNGKRGFWNQIFSNGLANGKKSQNGEPAPPGVGLEPSLKGIKLKRKPFVSIHLPFYNEKRVADRILAACTAFDYPNFEVIVCDDSTDETTEICEDWARKDKRVKVIHRPTREGFKGGALKYAVEQMDPKTEFVIVLDADFVPYPDTIELFLKYFKANNQNSENYKRSNVAVIGGYQWHVLNKSENWITRGVRTEYAGSYVIERAGRELLGLLKQISGSVYMIRADVLKELGWGTSITEDFELTLKLYEKGYKVVYTPYIQAPAECVSTLKRLIRQRMRWAEGHSNNVKKMFFRLLGSSRLTIMEKLEFLYLVPYYLQAFFFVVGTLSWLLAEAVFRARLPFWTSLWGWSLVLTNMMSLPLVNAIGLFLEESDNRDYLGLLSFIALSFLLVPFQAYASVKGFLEKEEGTWFRTPKTGKITDIFTRGRFYSFLNGIFPLRPGAKVEMAPIGKPVWVPALAPNLYLALNTAHSRFDNFGIRSRRSGWVSKVVLALLLAFSVTLLNLSRGVPEVFADVYTFYLDNKATADLLTANNEWELLEGSYGSDSLSTGVQVTKGDSVGYRQFNPGVVNTTNADHGACSGGSPGTADGYGWLFPTPFSDGAGSIDAGTWTFEIYESEVFGSYNGFFSACVYTVTISGGAIGTSTLLFQYTDSVTDLWDGVAGSHTYTTSQPSFSPADDTYLYVEFFVNMTSTQAAPGTRTIYFGTGPTYGDPYVQPPNMTIPEKVVFLIVAAPFIPLIVIWMKKRHGDGDALAYLDYCR